MSLCMLMLLVLGGDSASFEAQERQWRKEREERMKSDTSWLTVVGLFWLEEGDNTFGSGQEADLVLPKHSTVALAGTLRLKDGKVHYEMNRGQHAMIDDKTMPEGELEVGKVLTHNHLRMFLIERDGRLALRVRDLRTQGFVQFEKLHFFQPKEKYVVEATFEPYSEPKTIQISTVIDTEIDMLVPGELHFTLKGKELTLLPTLTTMEDDEFFIMLKDKTAPDKTYGGGRFMYVPRPKEGETSVTLNFNRAYNAPCAYTDFATCPVPPASNWLDVAIEAGERLYKAHHDPR